MYALLLMMLLAGASCLPYRPGDIPDQYQPTGLYELRLSPTREKRFVMPILERVLGTAGEIVTSVGVGLIGAKAGMQQGGLAARILNNGGNWGFVHNQPAPYYNPNNYNSWNYYDPNNPYGYYGSQGPNGYYG